MGAENSKDMGDGPLSSSPQMTAAASGGKLKASQNGSDGRRAVNPVSSGSGSVPIPIAVPSNTAVAGNNNNNISHATPTNGHQRGITPSTPASPMATYVDHRSLVYTLPAFPKVPDAESGTAKASSLHSSNNCGNSRGACGRSAPVEFAIGTPATPLTPGGQLVTSARRPPSTCTTPIAIPTYNHDREVEATVGSPVLRSYRQHSRSLVGGESPTLLSSSAGGPAVTFTGSPNSFSLGATVSGLMHADMGGMGASSTSSHPGGTVTASAAAAGSSSVSPPIHARFLEIAGYPLGLENFGNTCYCNATVQLLYHCTPLRLRLLELHSIYTSKKGGAGFAENTILFHLCNLFYVMHKSNNRKKDNKKRELISPKALLQCICHKNAIFNNNLQQDAHEFAMYVLNDIMETEKVMMADPKNQALFSEEKKKSSGFSFWKSSSSKKNKSSSNNAAANTHNNHHNNNKVPSLMESMTPLQSILHGLFGSLTACLECGNITARDELFIDLSVETRQGSSLVNCLHHFGDPEHFHGSNKLRCDVCKKAVCAAKTIHVQKLPQYAMIIHLKRFQYDVQNQTFTKKADHVALPMEMDVEEYITDPDANSAVVDDEGEGEGQKNKKEEEGVSGASGGKPSPVSKQSNKSNSDGAAGGVDSPSTATTAATTTTTTPDEIKRKLRGVARHKARFALTGFVAHIGEGPNLGHYFTCVRYGPQLWRRFDDDTVTVLTEREVQQYFGVPINLSRVVTTTAYILLYERVA